MLYDLILMGTLIASALPEPALCPDYANRRATALEHAKTRLWPGAAREFAALWRDCQRDPRDLHNAAVSFFSDDHFALALQLWRELRKLPYLDARLRKVVDERIEDAMAQTVPVKLRFDAPQPAGDGMIKAYRDPDKVEVDVSVTGAELDLRLDRGDWTIVYEARGHRIERTLNVSDAPLDVLVFALPARHLQVVQPTRPTPTPSVQIAPASPPRPAPSSQDIAVPSIRPALPFRPSERSPPRLAPTSPPLTHSPLQTSQVKPRPDRTSPILMGIGVGVGAIGLGVTLHQSSHLSAILEPGRNASLTRALGQRDVGAALLGSGLALALTGGTAQVPKQQYQRGIAIGETALGSVLAVAGIVVRFVALRQARVVAAAPLDDAGITHWQRLATLVMTGTVLSGTGLGFAVGGATKLIVRRGRPSRERGAKLGALITRGVFGLLVLRKF